ncbi:MAG: autotransporter outer membrane beta-barrel domain-containing protein [Rhodospirillales bacterium]|nr:autotransporter outer membrane beta-barrel domain-containing protein [Rhodospirillales bacterium]
MKETLAVGVAWLTGVCLILADLVLSATDVSGQTTAVCSNTPGTEERIECTEEATSTSAIDIDAEGVDIDTTTDDEHGIHAEHLGTGDITIDVGSSSTVDTSTIDTGGAGASGIFADHEGTGRIQIHVRDATITTAGGLKVHGSDTHFAHGIFGRHYGTATGDIVLDVADTTITTGGAGGDGILGYYSIASPADETVAVDLDIDVRNSSIRTTGGGDGIGAHYIVGSGDIDLDVVGTVITTSGGGGSGIHARHRHGTGDIGVHLQNTDITTSGQGADGIYAENDRNLGASEIVIDVQGGSITTGYSDDPTAEPAGSASGISVYVGISRDSLGPATTDIDIQNLDITTRGSSSIGIDAFNAWLGDIVIDARGGSIRTEGQYSHGIEGWISGLDDLTVTTHAGHTITTTGDDASGILGVVSGSQAMLAITVGGTVEASGANAHGVEVGNISQNRVWQAAPVDDDGFRDQTVTVNGRVHGGTGESAGVWLAGGGRVYIGPQGTLGADSGIAILATGDTRPQNQDDPVLKPKLYVDMNLNGRRVAQVIGDDWIVNDGGETTVAVNNVTLHDGATGATGATAANGAWDVTFRDEGVTVDRADPADWVVSEPATGVVADRDFSSQDFTEIRRPQPPVQPQLQPEPEPETEASGEPVSDSPPQSTGSLPGDPQTGSSDALEGETGQGAHPGSSAETNRFDEVYAPRAAVYESLPGALLSLSKSDAADVARLRSPGSPFWFGVSGGTGSHESGSTTVGAEYDARRLVTEAGVDFQLSDDLSGLIAARQVWGSVDVSAPTGGGTIGTLGRGVSVGLAWQGADGFYGNGRLSATWFDLTARSDSRGTLEEDADALVRSVDLEAGRRFDVGERTRLTTRAWLNRSDASLQRFTDAVGSRVSFTDAEALTVGAGAVIETDFGWNAGQDSLSLYGSLGVERTVGGGETVVLVSGEQLRSTIPDDGVVIGVGATRRWGRFALGAELRARGLGSSDDDYSARLSVRMAL